MRVIVVPVSFSAQSAAAARYAADMAQAIGAKLHLVHVIQHPGAYESAQIHDFLLREFRDSACVLLEALARELRERTSGQVRISVCLETGEPGKCIRDYCRSIRPFLVIMGAGETSEKQGIGYGEASGMMSRLAYPLLIVPGGAVFRGIRRIALACDQEDIYAGVAPVLPLLHELGELLGACFDVVHVVTGGESIGDAASEYERWKKQAGLFGAQLHMVRDISVGAGISYFLEKYPADWLLVLPKKHSMLEFHKSRARDIVPYCTVPLMSVPE